MLVDVGRHGRRPAPGAPAGARRFSARRARPARRHSERVSLYEHSVDEFRQHELTSGWGSASKTRLNRFTESVHSGQSLAWTAAAGGGPEDPLRPVRVRPAVRFRGALAEASDDPGRRSGDRALPGGGVLRAARPADDRRDAAARAARGGGARLHRQRRRARPRQRPDRARRRALRLAGGPGRAALRRGAGPRARPPRPAHAGGRRARRARARAGARPPPRRAVGRRARRSRRWIRRRRCGSRSARRSRSSRSATRWPAAPSARCCSTTAAA